MNAAEPSVRTAPAEVERPSDETVHTAEVPWIVIVWNDPVNLMTYVTWVFQRLFGYSLQRATELMLDVHHRGKAVVASGAREQCESHVARLHSYGLWATMQQDR